MLELFETLGSSLDLRAVTQGACPLLMRLIPADYAALGVSLSGKPEDFEWLVAELPPAFFAAYPEMAAHDFVRRAVSERPSLVLSDRQMVPRRELEQNMMYQRAREVGAPLEHVLAVMLHEDERWQSGLSLYRARRRPFSERERARLQRVVPALARSVSNCQAFRGAKDWGAALERALSSSSTALALASEDGKLLARSDTAAAICGRWFASPELAGSRVPQPLVDALGQARGEGSATWRREFDGKLLEVRVEPLQARFGAARWLLQFEERDQAPAALPAGWARLLSVREREVAAGVLRGWDNRLIAAELGCAEATVKKHLQRVFDKLGLPSRLALVAQALGSGRREKSP